MSKHRFKVIEKHSFYAVLDSITGEERPMGDGVDTIFKENGKAMSPGSEWFRRCWERWLNEEPLETLEAYFYKQWEKERAQ